MPQIIRAASRRPLRLANGTMVQPDQLALSAGGSFTNAIINGGTIQGAAHVRQGRTTDVPAQLVPTAADAGGFIGAALTAAPGTITLQPLAAGLDCFIGDVLNNGATYPPTFSPPAGGSINGGTAYEATRDGWLIHVMSLGGNNFAMSGG